MNTKKKTEAYPQPNIHNLCMERKKQNTVYIHYTIKNTNQN